MYVYAYSHARGKGGEDIATERREWDISSGFASEWNGSKKSRLIQLIITNNLLMRNTINSYA